MQAGQWGAAASAASGVRSNATLDSGRCQLNLRCSFLLTLASRQPVKNPEKWRGLMLKSKCCTRCPLQRFQLSGSALRTSLFSTFTALYTVRVSVV
jgi:hypothetical protein